MVSVPIEQFDCHFVRIKYRSCSLTHTLTWGRLHSACDSARVHRFLVVPAEVFDPPAGGHGGQRAAEAPLQSGRGRLARERRGHAVWAETGDLQT
jgi:hypothetical protein